MKQLLLTLINITTAAISFNWFRRIATKRHDPVLLENDLWERGE